MSKARRDLVLTGTADLELVLREVFTALTGIQLPTDVTDTDSCAYAYEARMYRTANGDGLTVNKVLDYGEFHTTVLLSLVVGDITIEDVTIAKRPKYGPETVLRISASADRIDDTADTVKRVATAKGFTFVTWEAGDHLSHGLPGPSRD